MSDLGLGNLAGLKEQVLGAALRTSTEFDRVIMAVGQGVARQLEKHCNRKFARVEGDTFVCYADRTLIILPRYPIESVTLIEQKSSELDGYVSLGAVNSVLQSIAHDKGILQFGAQLGSFLEQVRITYTGGYFYETAEPDEGTTSPPAGSTALPEDVRLAWFLQCRAMWQTLDKLGTDIATTGGTSQFVTGTLPSLELLPAVKELLASHRRFA